jgi:putative spermidine/putrescine transport system substrate-binding protein
MSQAKEVFMASRRALLLGSSATAFTSTTIGRILSAAAQADLRGKSLVVATYGGSWRDAVAKHIANPLVETGVHVDYVLGNPDDNLAKLISAKRQGQIPFDTIEGSPVTYPDAYKAGLLEKIDYAAIPGAKDIPDWAREEGQVITSWSPDGIVHNESRFNEAGIAKPRDYIDLRNPKLKERVAFPAPDNVFHWAAVVGLAYQGGGDEENLIPAIRYIKEIAPVYFYTASVELSTRFGSGDIWAAPWSAGWAVRMKRAGLPISVAYASFGKKVGSLWPDPVSIVKGTPNREAAMAFLSSWLSIDGLSQFCAATGVLPVSAAARAKFVELDPLSRSMLPWTDEDIENSYRLQWSKLDAKKWRGTWNREIQTR